MRKDCGHVGDLQLFAKDLLTLSDAQSDGNGCPANWETERPFVAADSLRASGRLRLRVRGESMVPSLWPGDEVEVLRCAPEEMRCGEIVLAMRDGRFFVHRLVGRSDTGGFLLRGDSMPAAHPEYAEQALLGRVSGAPLGWWRWLAGRLFSRCAPALRLALTLGSPLDRRRKMSSDQLLPGHLPSHASPGHSSLAYPPPSARSFPEQPNARA